MKIHRWWLALVAALWTPWIGPHIDRFVPLGWVLFRAAAEETDLGFWVTAGVLLSIAYVLWLVLLTGLTAWFVQRGRNRGRSRGRV